MENCKGYTFVQNRGRSKKLINRTYLIIPRVPEVFFSVAAKQNKKIVPSGYMSLMRHGLLVRLKYVEVVSVFTAQSKRCSRGLVVRVVQKKSIIFVLLSIYIQKVDEMLYLKQEKHVTQGLSSSIHVKRLVRCRPQEDRTDLEGGGGNPEKFVCKSKKSPTKLFAGMKKIVCRKMTPEKKCFHRQRYRKKIVCLGKIFIPQLPKK